MVRSSVFVRHLYLNKGNRVEGLKRDPAVAFTNSEGQEYALNEGNISHIKSYLGPNYQVPDEVALQVITHKSFGNGIKPYNEKLAAMGSKLLNLSLAKYVINNTTTNNNDEKELEINNKNLSSLGSLWSRELCGRASTGYFANLKGLNKVMFWKSRNPSLSFESSGALKVSAQLLYSLIGAVNFYHGKEKAEAFIEENIVRGLEEVTTELLKEQ
ncbi:hypothetical protein KGF56_004244 [Candida oxycetoniae]|uniref:RNase III domain-containing protein n=1 Tax=Candida oxycetoniae TaxID=497107 RepID=A0AAI9WWB4_9ASCO|nr:uncharacterized protein KGF56_004244 [Candida oxycetoniae]KAI3402991.2 hypothetical protein KGF56_004244 [Candida oxycetoniae]